MPKPRSAIEKNGVTVKGRGFIAPPVQAAAVAPMVDRSVSAGAFFTPSYSATVPKQDPNSTVKDKSSSAGDQSTGVKATLHGQRIPLEHQLQTSFAWAEPPLSSVKSLRVASMTPFACPPKIEWTNPGHEAMQKETGRMIEKELYSRFLAFGKLHISVLSYQLTSSPSRHSLRRNVDASDVHIAGCLSAP